ncbi:MAG TPA: aminodeoxychorismate/anthranilate synthase component II [Patescibacteria group bacterium]|nr:aminodeoxychorismate/anthranilate synthase component II [Patescibacteria group bacterium]
MINILIIDNYDSFTYNLEHLFGQIEGVAIKVMRNDSDLLGELEDGVYNGVVISPGPGSPLDQGYFGKNNEVISRFGSRGLPILGVCLGFQGIASVFGAELKQAEVPQHGKTSRLSILKPGSILKNIPDGIEVMRYHSLMINADKPIPEDILILAETSPDSLSYKQNGREIMALAHRDYPIYGIQFHPESYATETGSIMANNFVDIIKG